MNSKTWQIRGGLFQAVLISTFLYRTFAFAFFSGHADMPIVGRMFSVTGMAIFTYCLYVLYFKKQRTIGLITSGVFKYTRHPMYTGLAFMDIAIWFVSEWSLMFLISAAALYIALVVAGYCQEKETVVRFGKDAEEYYKKTPRLFFMYPMKSLILKNE